MPGHDHMQALAVRNYLALYELREFSQRAPHLSFNLAMRTSMVDALRAAREAADRRDVGSSWSPDFAPAQQDERDD